LAPLLISVLLFVTPGIPAIRGSFQAVGGYVRIGSAFILAQTAITPVWASVADIEGRKLDRWSRGTRSRGLGNGDNGERHYL
jgi:hypothetical protein